ncbi:MAG: CPBP family intramembrane metalloprotease [Actinomycetota bacterium]|nr:CPBP family intramembrane metalloprotease [Actinomycetota bacterium]
MSSPPSSSAPPPVPAAAPPEPSGSPGKPDVVPWPLWSGPAGVVLGFGLGAVASILVDVAARAEGSSLAHPTPAVSIASDVLFDLSFVAAAIYFASLTRRARLSDFGFRRVGLRAAVSAFILALIGYYGLTAVYAAVFRLHGRDKLPSELGVSHSTAALVAAAMFVCVIAPIAEEFFFRGFFFGALRRWRIQLGSRNLGPWVAAAITGVLFGLAHTGSASSQYLIPLGFLGFVLCLVRWWTGSLYPCIAIHSANNALALGVNQLSWSTLQIIGLVLGSWAVVAAITGPLGVHSAKLR